MENEKYWLLLGGIKGDIWWGRRQQPTKGRVASVSFDPYYVIYCEERKGNVVGFLHTHPNMTASPSARDDKTMHAWVASLGKPLVCCILGKDGLRAWWYDDDENPPYEASVHRIKNLVFGCTVEIEEDLNMLDNEFIMALEVLNPVESTVNEIKEKIVDHPSTEDCPDAECSVCGMRDCPNGEPLHYHHDGCPACYKKE